MSKEESNNTTSEKSKKERKDVPVKIGDKEVSTDPVLVRTITCGEDDKKTTEMIRKKTIQKSKQSEGTK